MRVRDILDEHKQGFYKSGKFEPGQIHLVRISDITDDAFLDETTTPMIDVDADITERFGIKKNDFLFARTGGAGRFCLIKNDVNGIFASYLIRFRFNKNYDASFLRYFFLSDSFQYELQSKIHGGVNQNVHAENIKDCAVPEISLSEQQRIVSIFDEAFAAIDQAKQNLLRNLQNTKELFQSELLNIFTTKGEGWVEKSLGEVSDVEYGYTDKSTHKGDYRYVRITDIDKNGELILEDKKYINHSKEAEAFLINDNDLLMARTGATFAKVLLFNGDEPSVFASYLIRIKFKEKFENKLYWYFTKTPNYWEQANSLSSGAAQPHFNGAALKQVIFSYPKSLVEQKKLVERFDTLSTEIKNLENIYQKKLNALEELKKSILQKAFSGELTEKKTAETA